MFLHMNVSNVNDQLYKIKKIGKIKIKLITFCVFAKIYRINQFGQKTCITHHNTIEIDCNIVLYCVILFLGASVIRMINHIIGSTAFQLGLQNYLREM